MKCGTVNEHCVNQKLRVMTWIKDIPWEMPQCSLGGVSYHCEYVTGDRSLYDGSDAVVFDAFKFRPEDLPQTRPRDQIWVFSTLEPPPHIDMPSFM